MKKWIPAVLAGILLMTGCAPKFEKQNEVVQEKDDKKKKAIIPNYQITENSYRTIVPVGPSKSRGLVVSNINSKYDLREFESGLMRVAKETFSPEKYVFQEGQYLDTKTVRLWLNRKFTPAQLKKQKMTEKENLGLNPVNDEKGSIEEQNKRSPIYLAHVLEHDYLVKEDKTVKLGGVTIGLALNSVHYYQKEQFGDTFEQNITHKQLAAEGKKIAEQVLPRLRSMKGLEQVPITIALFEQRSKNTVIPGSFFAYATAGSGSSSLSEWKDIDEQYVLFPSEKAEKEHREDLNYFLNFKQDVETYFPNFNGVIGRAFYRDGELRDISIDIPIQLYGEAEVIGFTQYLAGLVMDHFRDYINVQVNITSVNGAEGLIVRKAGEKEPFVHVYK